MTTTDPQFMYMVLVLPGLFGLTLVGEGLYKVIHENFGGVINIVFGFGFISLVILGYFLFSTYSA